MFVHSENGKPRLGDNLKHITFIHLSKHTAMYTKLLVADARSILLGKFLGFSYDNPNHGRYFRVEEVKKKGR